jgi:DnaD/phage-associated family protein
VAREREYLDAWVDMGFPNDAIRLAYERTVLKKQTLNWPYMNSILKSWHSKGLHTLAQIQAGDSDRPRKVPAAGAAPAQGGDERMRRDMERLERYAERKK